MKRILALLLAMMMIAGMMVSCTGSEEEEEEENKGAQVTVYLGSEIRNWDPAQMYTQASAAKFFSLVYEGLTRINAEGQLEYALARSSALCRRCYLRMEASARAGLQVHCLCYAL